MIQLFGRQWEANKLYDALCNERVRLIALIGESGIGKTHLAQAVVQQLSARDEVLFPDGIHLLSFGDLGYAIAKGSALSAQDCILRVRYANQRVAPLLHEFENDVSVTTGSGSPPVSYSTCADCESRIEENLAALIGQTLKLPVSVGQSVHELTHHLSTRRLLLVFDSFEQIYPTLPFIVELLQTVPSLKILLTSQLPIESSAKSPVVHQFSLVGLPCPPMVAGTPEHLDDGEMRDIGTALANTDRFSDQSATHDDEQSVVVANDALHFFCHCAKEMDPSFRLTAQTYQDVWTICHLVNGSPIGIELAAGLLKLYTPAELVNEIRRDYTILVTKCSGVMPRHREIATILATSWQQLGNDEQQLLVECSLFVEQFAREALLQITSATPDLVAALLQKNVLYYDAETKRFALPLLWQRFVTDQQPAWSAVVNHAGKKHAYFFLNLLQEREESLLSNVAIFQQIVDAMPEIEHAWQWAVTENNFTLLGAGVTGFVAYYRLRGLFHLGLQQVLAPLNAFTSHWSSWLEDKENTHFLQGPSTEEIKALRAFFRAVATLYLYQGDEINLTKTATTMLTWSARVQDYPLRCLAYDGFARAAQIRDQVTPALTFSRLAVDLRQYGREQLPHGHVALTLGIGHVMAGEYEAAIGALTTILRHEDLSDLDLKMRTTFYVGLCHQRLRSHSAAHFHFSQAIALGQHFPFAHDLAPPMILMAEVWRTIGNYDRAQEILDSVAAKEQTLSPVMKVWRLIEQGRVAYDGFGASAAYEPLMSALRIAGKANFRALEQRTSLFLGHTLLTLGATVDAQIYYQRAYTLQQTIESCHWTADAAVGLARLAALGGDWSRAQTYIAPVVERLLQRDLRTTEEPYLAYRHLYTLLTQHGDQRAGQLLQAGQAALRAEAARITDPQMQQSFLSNVAVNQQLLAP